MVILDAHQRGLPAAGYDLVFLVAAGLGLTLAVAGSLLPRDRRG
ncbi:hypothetical protein Sru01_37210 [Sphaerisporangium rufum]|uniref:Uncharacterized protein n=1 Tax=Sphaerisporangium rufum TaxID=1381558 RepID=A0A919R365_9ACTN|nr:hypothetical protein [Sphaerisporangium rufum]GII78739.1 hypothetical protein Sru01_37210 [Sphaerisporangium rufum]